MPFRHTGAQIEKEAGESDYDKRLVALTISFSQWVETELGSPGGSDNGARA